ncbi:hypothetical protein GCM10009759_77240 [Kitasatospora saccharophila]|uniref:ESAT-6 protein secretion system EspG family protein n=1 Tax=Kitasatospora saccharophila TaxID=407973 RepID=A0ABN2YCQ0_9ACTN
MSGTPAAPWRELLADLGDTYDGCTAEEVTNSAADRPEAAAWLAATALTGVEGISTALTTPWAVQTPQQAGAIAAALTVIQHQAEQAKSHLLDALEAMERRGEVQLTRFGDDPQEPLDLALDLFKLQPSPETADHLFAEFSAVPLLRTVPTTYVEVLEQVAELLPDLVVPGSGVTAFEDPEHPEHQGFVQLRHQGQEWRLYFYDHEWFLDGPSHSPPAYLLLDRIPLPAAHPTRIAEATRAKLAEFAQARSAALATAHRPPSSRRTR